MYQVLDIIGLYRSSGACCSRSFHSSIQSSIKDLYIPTSQCHNFFCGWGRCPKRRKLAGRGEWMLGSCDTSGCWNQRVLTAEKYHSSTFLIVCQALFLNRKTKKNSWLLTYECVDNSDSVVESFNVVKDDQHKRRKIPSASSALYFGGILGLVQATLLISAAKPLLNFMGVTSVSPFV